MICIVPRAGSPEALGCGFDVARWMSCRPEEYAVMFLDNAGFSVLFAADETEAAQMVLRVLHAAPGPHDGLHVPQSVADILAANAWGYH